MTDTSQGCVMTELDELADQLPPALVNLTIERAMSIVAKRYKIRPSALLTKNRTRPISWPRHEVFWLAHNAGQSLPNIGKYFGMDHTSVLYGIRRVEAEIDCIRNELSNRKAAP
jgi:chromosomal replication initiation ATPase DnaA